MGERGREGGERGEGERESERTRKLFYNNCSLVSLKPV